MSRQLLPTLLLAPSLLYFPHAARAQGWDPFPELPPGEHAAVKKSLDRRQFDELRACLRSFESRVGASYYAAVVEVSAPGGRQARDSDAVPYADALYQAWLPDGRLDPATHVLMVMSLANRGIAIHPGIRWADLGFEGAAITRAIDASRFGDLARGGDFGRALCALAADVDRRLAELGGRPRQEPAATAVPPQRESAASVAAPRRGAASRPPWSVLWGAGGLVTLLLVGLRLRRRKRARKRMEEEIERWKSHLANSAERLFELERQHPLYFAAGTRRWSGESKDLDQRCADAVNHLYLLYSKAAELLDEAERRAAGRHGFSISPRAYEEIRELLRSSPVRFETGEAEERRRIFLPLTRQYEGTASTLLDDLDRCYGEASSLLDEVAELEEKQRQAIAAAKRAATEATAQCTRRGELGLPTAPLLGELEEAMAQRREGEDHLDDPKKALAVLGRALAELERVAARARLGNEIVARLRGEVSERGRELRGEVERLRQAGFRLDEPGFQPDVELDRDLREAHDVERLVAAGEEEAARQRSAALDDALGALGERLRAVERARDGVPPALQGIEAAAREIRDALPRSREILQRLEKEHAPETFRDAADNLEELDRLLSELDGWGARIRDDHRGQRYLAALAALEECEELVAGGRELVAELARAEETLNALRDRARELATACRGRLDEIAGLAAEAGVGGELSRRVAERDAAVRELLAAAGEPRPNWPTIEAGLAGAASDLEHLHASIREELDAFRRAHDLAAELGERLGGLQRQVDDDYRDRPHVARVVADVAAQLGAFRDRLDGAAGSGRELLAAGESLVSAVARAEETWWKEMELVKTAETELRAAQSQLRTEDGRGYGYGVASDCRAARAVLAEAESDARGQRWEEVLTKARRARTLLEEEANRSRRRARMLEEEARRRAESLRRQRQWEDALASASVASRTPDRPRAPRQGPSLGPSFGSSFTSRSRRSSPSGGSSFGGTRSGGSSW